MECEAPPRAREQRAPAFHFAHPQRGEVSETEGDGAGGFPLLTLGLSSNGH